MDRDVRSYGWVGFMFNILRQIPEFRDREWKELAALCEAMESHWRVRLHALRARALARGAVGAGISLVLMMIGLAAVIVRGFGGSRDTAVVLFAFVLPLFVAFVLSIARAVRWHEEQLEMFIRQLLNSGTCLACGYRMSGLQAVEGWTVCPECGTRYTGAVAETSWTGPE